MATSTLPDLPVEKIRRLSYRLQRQGMLELDAWLSPLILALKSGTPDILDAIETLLQKEVPELQAMQTGKKAVPEELKPWLKG